jgi:hypothetical protein
VAIFVHQENIFDCISSKARVRICIFEPSSEKVDAELSAVKAAFSKQKDALIIVAVTVLVGYAKVTVVLQVASSFRVQFWD